MSIVGKFMNVSSGSDTNPYKIVKQNSEKSIEIQPMNAEFDKSTNLEFSVGGFAGHCHNPEDQKWIYTEDSDAPTATYTLRKDGKWRQKGVSSQWYNGQRVSEAPRKYYDYNF